MKPWDECEPTADRTVRIEHKEDGYVVYQADDGRRWSVRGYCIRLGNCLIGANIETPDGLVQVRSKRHITQLQRQLGKDRIDSELDVPVAPGFSGCCEFHIVELPRAN